MEQRRFILFIALSFAILIGWYRVVAPVLFPRLHQQPAGQLAQEDDAQPDGKMPAGEEAGDAAGQAAGPAGQAADPARQTGEAELKDPAEVAERDAGDQTDDVSQTAEKDSDRPGAGPSPENELSEKLPEYEQQTVELGSRDPESGYFISVAVESQGASVSSIRLNDPRYCELRNRDLPLQVVGNTDTDRRTLDTSIPAIDDQLKRFDTSLSQVHWKVEKIESDRAAGGVNSSVTLSYTSPDGKLKVSKRYAVEKAAEPGYATREVRDNTPAGYVLQFELTIENLGGAAKKVAYVLQGPVGLPLENAEHTRKYRDLELGFLKPEEQALDPSQRTVDAKSLAVGTVVKAEQKGSQEEWKRPLLFIGVDIQYFTALLFPGGDQLKTSYVASAKPLIVGDVDAENKNHTDLSVELTSDDIPLPPGGEVTHSYQFFAGPKRRELLEPLGAVSVLDFGMFAFFSKIMLWVLGRVHDVGLPYGIAIICLTVMVRGCMFPLSRKQAAGAKKMKDLQPKLAELKKKYENDKEKFGRAQLELFRENNYNPLSGCLPIFIQFPIFIGLYQALNNSVDLRMASFLWVDNLAAPDAVFRMPFELPFLGSDFNVLPIVTVLLFVVQQKMFMPPPTDDQQAMQYKMMNYMMIFMGFLFYHVPAGLCVYFIASSLWGIGERKMLDLGGGKRSGLWSGLWGGLGGGKRSGDEKPDPAGPAAATRKPAAKQAEKPKNGKLGLWQKLLERADAAANQNAKKQSDSNGRSNAAKQKSSAADKKKKRRSRSRR